MTSFIRNPVSHMFRVVALSFLWNNRRDVARWARFAKRACSPSSRPDPQDLKLEARVRASISADPILRVDPSIRDLRVRDGAVVLEAPQVWHNEALALSRLLQLDGVESVRTARNVDESSPAHPGVEHKPKEAQGGTKVKMSNTAQQVKSKVKETVGKATGNKNLEGKGKADQAKSAMKNVGEQVQDASTNVQHAVGRD